MSNMSYCRFENTASDFRDCVDNWFDGEDDLSATERKAKVRILRMIGELLESLGVEFESVDLDIEIKDLQR